MQEGGGKLDNQDEGQIEESQLEAHCELGISSLELHHETNWFGKWEGSCGPTNQSEPRLTWFVSSPSVFSWLCQK